MRNSRPHSPRRLRRFLFLAGYGLLAVAIGRRLQRWLAPPIGVEAVHVTAIEPPRRVTAIDAAPLLEELAEVHSGGWVYEVDPTYTGPEPAPVHRIIRAWRTDETGTVLPGQPVENPYYRPGEDASGSSDHAAESGERAGWLGWVRRLSPAERRPTLRERRAAP